MLIDLPENRIDVWLLPITEWTHQNLDETFIEELLSAQELERFLRFRPMSKKDEFIASRLLLRYLLTRYTECEVEKTEAIPDEMGRPFWFEAERPIEMFFSLSHTKDVICCAISTTREIGCDVESLQRRKYEVDLTERVFSPKERQHYKGLPQEKRSEFFYRSWTLKEAFIKAVGQGLRVPLTSLSFTHKATADSSFQVSSKNLGEKWTNVPYTFVSKLPAANYSLGIATPLASPEINYFSPEISGKKITPGASAHGV